MQLAGEIVRECATTGSERPVLVLRLTLSKEWNTFMRSPLTTCSHTCTSGEPLQHALAASRPWMHPAVDSRQGASMTRGCMRTVDSPFLDSSGMWSKYWLPTFFQLSE